MTTTYTDAQIETQCTRLKQLEQMGESFRVTHAEFRGLHDMLRSLLAERKAAIQPKGGQVADGWVLVPIELPMLRVPEIKDMLAEEFRIYDCQARPLWAELLKIVAGVGIVDLLDPTQPPQHVHGDGGYVLGPIAHVGDSRFEEWYSQYDPVNAGPKQRCRDAYAGGLTEQAEHLSSAPTRGDEVKPTAWLVVDAKGKKFTIYNPELAEAIKQTAEQVGSELRIKAVCDLPESGWYCTREVDHAGPCAAWPNHPPAQPAQPVGDSQMTGEAKPIDAYERMFTAAVESIAEISEALGIPEDEASVANGIDLILDAIAELVEQSVAQPRVPNNWRPIETAPKDGTAVIFYDEHEPHIGRWWIQRGHVSCWSSDSWEPGSCEPKYWMPLPSTEPPAKEA